MKKVLTYSLLLCALLAFSQEKKKEVKDTNLPKGNKDFEAKDYVDAEAEYRISNSKSPTKAIASYNLGNAIYRQKKPGEAIYAYSKAIENAKDKKQKHMAYHNLGNVLMEQKNYQAAVEAYKNALRNNPTDDQTRYNFALAKEMLKNNPPPKPKDDKKDPPKGKDDDKSQKPKENDKDKNKGDEKDKGDKGKDKDKDNKDKGDQKDKNKDKGDQKDKDNGNGKDKENKADANPSGASPNKDQMQNMLNALNNEEKKVQDKLNAKKVKAQPTKQEKDW